MTMIQVEDSDVETTDLADSEGELRLIGANYVLVSFEIHPPVECLMTQVFVIRALGFVSSGSSTVTFHYREDGTVWGGKIDGQPCEQARSSACRGDAMLPFASYLSYCEPAVREGTPLGLGACNCHSFGSSFRGRRSVGAGAAAVATGASGRLRQISLLRSPPGSSAPTARLRALSWPSFTTGRPAGLPRDVLSIVQLVTTCSQLPGLRCS